MTQAVNILYGLWQVQDQVMGTVHGGFTIMIGFLFYVLYLPRETP